MSIAKEIVKVGNFEWFYLEAKPVNETQRLPVVLLHGLLSQSHTWTAVMPDLATSGFRAIAPDWIGFGYSEKPNNQDFAYSPDAFANAFGEFIEALKIDKFYLVVQGFLASVGLQYALRHPEKIERLAIINTPISTEAKLPWRIQMLGWPLVGEMMTQDPLVVDRTLEAGCRYRIGDKDLDVYRGPFLRSSDAGRSLLATVRNIDLPMAMAEIENGWKEWDRPTLIMWGMGDPWLRVESAQSLAKSLKNGEFVKLESASHYPQEHWSENVSNGLLLFLRRKEV